MPILPDAFQSAVQHHQAGNLPQAEQLYRQILQADPRHVDALHMLGLIAFQVGRLETARDLIGQAVQLKPDFAEAHSNLGAILQQLGKPDEAIASWRRAVQCKPFAEAYSNLGLALKEQGRLDEAVANLREAVRLKPSFAEAHTNLGAALQALGQLDAAAASCRQALQIQPESAGAHCNLGLVLAEQKNSAAALACYREALRLNTNMVEAHYNLGNLLLEQGDMAGAIASFERVLSLKADDVAALALLVHALQHACRWDNLPALAERLVEAADRGDDSGTRIAPFSLLALPKVTTAEQQLQCARRWIERQPAPTMRFATTAARPAEPVKKLTIGYLSADYFEHATAYLVAELLEQHDRERFQVIAYSYGPDDGSPIRRRIQAGCDRFVELRASSHADAAARIYADEVDVLVDLKGHTRNARPQILAMRPAPIQVSYLGYPGTMGAPFVDYVLVDKFIVPPDQQPFFSEKLVHLPGSYQVNDSQRVISTETPTRAEYGLPDNGFVFCCFNNSFKITPQMFGVWMELLRAVPTSVLWLLEANPEVRANLLREAAARGVDPPRLVFAPRKPVPQHLARHRLADLALDCFPYGSHTTGSDTLWAGCPLLTLAGETFVTRVAGSLLRTVGLPELVTTSIEEYTAMALRLARDPAFLTEMRQRLAANRLTCGLFDGRRFARNVERAYETMWRIYAAGEPARAFAIEAG